MQWFMQLSPIMQALIGGLITWIFTAIGAALVFVIRGFKPAIFTLILGFAAGIMIAASFWGLLEPAIQNASDNSSLPSWLVISIGLIMGGLLIFGADKASAHIHIKAGKKKRAKEVSPGLKRSILLIISVFLENLPEGLAIGIAFGAAASGDTATATAAIISGLCLALATGIEDLPEGAIIAFSLKNEEVSSFKSFFWSELTAAMMPLVAILGALLVISFEAIMPYALALAAGAILYVVVAELIPEAQGSGKKSSQFAVLGFFVGFILMTILNFGLQQIFS